MLAMLRVSDLFWKPRCVRLSIKAYLCAIGNKKPEVSAFAKTILATHVYLQLEYHMIELIVFESSHSGFQFECQSQNHNLANHRGHRHNVEPMKIEVINTVMKLTQGAVFFSHHANHTAK